MGNSEGAALDFCKQLSEKYTPEFFKEHNLPPVKVETTCIQLDDFLEMHHAKFSRCLVIFVSSYGVGQAPLGAYRFRELCDAWKEQASGNVLTGLQYAICGLGSSSYPTYLKNPTTIDQGLTCAGAKRIGDLGKADATGLGDNSQDKVIARWVQSIWVPLAKALATKTEVSVEEMHQKTIPLLMKLDPDYTPPKEMQPAKVGGTAGILGLAVAGAALGTAAFVALQK